MVQSDEPSARQHGSPAARPEAPAVGSITGVLLDRVVTVTFTSPRPLTDEDVAAIRAAARPLLDELRIRGLTPAPMHAGGGTGDRQI